MMKKIVTGFISLSMCMLLMACGEAEVPQKVEVNPISLEAQQVPVNESGEAQSEGNSSDENPDMTQLNEDIPEENDSVLDDRPKEDGNYNENIGDDKKPDNTAPPETKENTDNVQDNPAEKVEEGTQDNRADPESEQSMPTVTLSGTIKSVESGSFTISRADVNSNVMVSTDETVNIIYTDNTEFVLCTSSDGGITANYTDGTPADLCSGKIANIVGAYEGSDFVAQSVKISSFN